MESQSFLFLKFLRSAFLFPFCGGGVFVYEWGRRLFVGFGLVCRVKCGCLL